MRGIYKKTPPLDISDSLFIAKDRLLYETEYFSQQVLRENPRQL